MIYPSESDRSRELLPWRHTHKKRNQLPSKSAIIRNLISWARADKSGRHVATGD